MSGALRVGVLGLGEAGGALAAGLAAAGCRVLGWDPADVAAPDGVDLAASDREAVAGADLVLSVNAAAVAAGAARSVVPALASGAIYADLNTGSPGLKAELAQIVRPAGATFADVALLGPLPGNGLRTPALASGPGAERFAEMLRPLGMPVEVVGPEPGDAAGRKLVRSVFMKGLALAVLESLEAAAAAGVEPWLRAEIVRALETDGEALVERLVTGSHRHARRRRDEMDAVCRYLEELGVEPRVSAAARDWFSQATRSP